MHYRNSITQHRPSRKKWWKWGALKAVFGLAATMYRVVWLYHKLVEWIEKWFGPGS